MTNAPLPPISWRIPCLIFMALAAAAWLAPSARAEPATQPGTSQLPGPDQLPAVEELPDPFLLKDGSRLKTREQWESHRRELRDLVLGYEYGRLPEGPGGEVKARESTSRKDEATGATEKSLVLTMGPGGKISTHLVLTIPAGNGPFPVIVKGDLCWGRVAPGIGADVVKHGYLLAEFDRTEIEPDKKDATGGVRSLYPNEDWGALAAWAWGYQRVLDYLLTRGDVDAKRVVFTGHSRGGKATLLAGVLDQRVALTVPNGSGCGGAGCYRFQPPAPLKSEDIAAILRSFPYWFQPQFGRFIGQVDKLPFDQHTVKALVAPRALFTTDALGDQWANPQGTQQTFLAAREVYKFLGAEEKIGLHYRPGKHDQNEQDWAALLDFADHLFAGKATRTDFNALPFSDLPKVYSWSAPSHE